MIDNQYVLKLAENLERAKVNITVTFFYTNIIFLTSSFEL